MQEENIGIAKFLGDRLRQWRKASGYRIIKLAEIISISQGSLSDLENNNSLPSAETIAKLHRYTDIDIFWLLFSEGTMKKGKTSAAAASYVSEATDSYGPNFRDQNLRELIEALTRIYQDGDSEKIAHLKGYLLGADPEK